MRISSLARLSRAFIAVVVGAGVWIGLSAQPLPPSPLCVDGEDGEDCAVFVAPDPADGDGYSLADALAGVPFAVATPVAPSISSEVTVTPETIAANKVNGRRLILSPGNYGNQTFGTQDQEIVIQDGVEIGTLALENTAQRLHFRAEPARSGRIRTVNTGGSWNNAISDLLFEGLYVDDTGSPDQNQWHGTRVAIINSFIQADMYAMGNFHEITDFVVANNHIHTYGTSQSNMRSHGAVRYVVVDNRLQKSGSGHHALRVHGRAPGDRMAHNIYVARNQMDGARVAIRGTGSLGAEDGGVSGESGYIDTVWFEDNVIYQPGDNSALFYTGNNTADSDRPLMMYVRNNSAYTDRQPWFSPGEPRSEWEVSNNTLAPYQPAPNTWDFR